MQMFADGVLAGVALSVAFLLRFDGWPPHQYLHPWLAVLPVLCAARVGSNHLFGGYRRIWRYTSIHDADLLVVAGFGPSLALFLVRLCPAYLLRSYAGLRLPLSVILIDFMLASMLCVLIRLFRRRWAERGERQQLSLKSPSLRKRVILIGAGSAGVMAAREFKARPDMGFEICGFLDDDPLKQGLLVQNLPVLGSIDELQRIVSSLKIEQAIITMASAPRKMLRDIVENCTQLHLTVQIVPGLYEILSQRVTTNFVHPLAIEDLLGRDSMDVNALMQQVQDLYYQKRVLVTGGAGSIGRELCRQLGLLGVAEVVILDKDENSVFEAMSELRSMLGDSVTCLRPLICDLRQKRSVEAAFQSILPQIVFHAAAHKHVPLMELNPCEAVLNNVLGTMHLLSATQLVDVERCVMVSTDKAVNPTSIMGATKRISELLFQAASHRNRRCRYSCVRFGNVLGSRGSVVPIFRAQIARGGPVTVTHPEMTRYFMTIPEAAQLIIQAGTLGQGGEIFLLDMGNPVRILDLARDMIRIAGLREHEDIEIQFTGLRPGEKIHEDLLTAEEGVQKTSIGKIHVAPPIPFDLPALDAAVEQLLTASFEAQEIRIREILSNLNIGFGGRSVVVEHALQSAAGHS